MRVFRQRQGVKLGLLSFCLAALLLVGCAGQNHQAARDDLTRAVAMLNAATRAGVAEQAPAEMAQARQDLDRAKALFIQTPQTGRLAANISIKNEMNRLSAESSAQAIAKIGQALQLQKDHEARLAQEQLNEQRATVEQEAAAKLAVISQEPAAEQNQDRETAAAALQTRRQEERLATAKQENVRQAMAAGKAAIAKALSSEFADHLPGWGAELGRDTLSISFVSPATAFESGSTWVNRPLRWVLRDFYPRLVELLTRPEYQRQIEQIQVVGFASKGYREAKSEAEGYRLNMIISQQRATNVVSFLRLQPTGADQWAKSHLAAAGLVDNQPVLTTAGLEDPQKSRRIEIRIIMADQSSM